MDAWEEKIGGLEKKIDSLQHAIEKLQRIFFWTLVVTVGLFILPLVGLLFVIPQFLSLYGSVGQ